MPTDSMIFFYVSESRRCSYLGCVVAKHVIIIRLMFSQGRVYVSCDLNSVRDSTGAFQSEATHHVITRYFLIIQSSWLYS